MSKTSSYVTYIVYTHVHLIIYCAHIQTKNMIHTQAFPGLWTQMSKWFLMVFAFCLLRFGQWVISSHTSEPVKATFAQRAQPGAGSPSLRTLQRPVRPVRVTQFPRPWPANHRSSSPWPSALISGRDLKREAQIFRSKEVQAELHSNSTMPSRAENVLMRKTQAFATRFMLPCHACPTAHTQCQPKICAKNIQKSPTHLALSGSFSDPSGLYRWFPYFYTLKIKQTPLSDILEPRIWGLKSFSLKKPRVSQFVNGNHSRTPACTEG